MERYWFVTIDTVRLKRTLIGGAARAALGALAPAAAATGTRLIDVCAVPCGIRAVAAATSIAAVRAFVHRFIATAACRGRAKINWRSRFRVASLTAEAIDTARTSLARMRAGSIEERMTLAKTKQPKTRNARTMSSALRLVERNVDEFLGGDEAAGRVRRYVAEHDAPANDCVAFERLCIVVFAQGIGYETVYAKHTALREAFAEFDPAAVSAFGEERIAALLDAPIIRNEAKIRACVENARRWVRTAGDGIYLGRVAAVAAADDAAAGWPALTAALRDDFSRLGEATARQTLKRWGFFTAIAHPGARRVLDRLGFVEPSDDFAAAQRLIGAAAQRLGRDPYSVEAALALFAGIGPCRKQPNCADCVVADRCPSASV